MKQLGPSVAFKRPQPQSQPESSQSTIAQAKATTTVDISCSHCGSSMTPMRLHVVAYFAQQFEGKKPAGKPSTRRVRPQFYGEALTRDEVYTRLEEEEKMRMKKAEEKREKQNREARKKNKKSAQANESVGLTVNDGE